MGVAPSDELSGVAAKTARGGLFLFIGNTSATVILAIGSIIIARLLGPSSFGLYGLTLFVPVLLVTLADAGMSYALVRLPAKLRSERDYEGANRSIRLGFLLKISLSVMAFLICYFGAGMIATVVVNRSELAPYLRLVSVLVVSQAVFDAASYSFIGLELMEYSASMQILYSILKSVLAPVLILLGFGLAGALAGYVLGVLVAGVAGAVILFAKHIHHTRGARSSSSVRLGALLGYGLPLYLGAVIFVVVGQYQNIVLAHFATNTQIGNFNAAGNFNSLLMILVYPITTAVFPMFSKMDRKSQRTDLARAFGRAVKYASLVLIPASLAVMVFSSDLVHVTYGSSYTSAPQYLIILSTLYLLTGLGGTRDSGVLGSFFYGVAETGAVLKMSAMMLAIYLPLGLALTWVWGPFGLLIAYVLSSASSTVYGVRHASAKFGARPDVKASGRLLLASLGAAIPTIVLIQLGGMATGIVNLTIGGPLYLVIYLTLAPVLGAVDKSDITNLRTILCRWGILARLANPVFDYEQRLLSAMGRD